MCCCCSQSCLFKWGNAVNTNKMQAFYFLAVQLNRSYRHFQHVLSRAIAQKLSTCTVNLLKFKHDFPILMLFLQFPYVNSPLNSFVGISEVENQAMLTIYDVSFPAARLCLCLRGEAMQPAGQSRSRTLPHSACGRADHSSRGSRITQARGQVLCGVPRVCLEARITRIPPRNSGTRTTLWNLLPCCSG